MKRLLLVLLLTAVVPFAFAGDGYHVQVKVTDTNMNKSIVYLAHYYAKSLPTIYKTDSAYFNKDGVAVFNRSEPVNGGIYMVLFSDQQTYFEFLMENGIKLDITTGFKDMPFNIQFKGSAENQRFQEYVLYLKDFSKKQEQLMAMLSQAMSAKDTDVIRKNGINLTQNLKKYREDYIRKYPKTLLSNIFSALFVPEVPEKYTDTTSRFAYYKEHFWDGFDFTDDRLINTPIYDAKLDLYFNNVVLPWPDSVQKEGDDLLAKTRGHKELFKYTLYWVTKFAQESKVMGMDQAFVYFVENYHMKGDAFWMTPDILKQYTDRAKKIAPNVIGNVAPEIRMVDWDHNPRPLSAVKAKYTLIVFWAPDCGGCQKEVPKIDSVYRAELKDKGLAIYAVRTDGEEELWKSFVEKHNIGDWTHVYDPEHKSDYKAQYDVYGTPSIYLLDENKIIIGKKLDHRTIGRVMEMNEEKVSQLKK